MTYAPDKQYYYQIWEYTGTIYLFLYWIQLAQEEHDIYIYTFKYIDLYIYI